MTFLKNLYSGSAFSKNKSGFYATLQIWPCLILWFYLDKLIREILNFMFSSQCLKYVFKFIKFLKHLGSNLGCGKWKRTAFASSNQQLGIHTFRWEILGKLNFSPKLEQILLTIFLCQKKFGQWTTLKISFLDFFFNFGLETLEFRDWNGSEASL